MATTDLDLYGLLGVSHNASDEEIKRAYRARARELHPDANGGDRDAEARFKEVSLAYEVLRDPERRARYDRYGPEAVFGNGAGAQGFDFESPLGDIFEAFFGSMGARTQRRGPMPGSDAEIGLRLAFKEAAFGAEKEVSIRLPVVCDECGGSGAARGTQPVVCPECGGAGETRRVRQSLLGQVVTSVACRRCQGLGELTPTPCNKCGGEGRRMEQRTFSVQVPAGVEDGSTLRLADRGPAGPRGGPNGSLFVQLRVDADERFQRAGDDVHTSVAVPMAAAALGTRASVETLEEPAEVQIERGTQSGTVVRLRGAGIPHLRGRGRGDLFVHVAVVTPTELSAREEELLTALADERGEDVAAPQTTEGVLGKIRSVLH
ncbi:MAG: molecular chaperone DnaJ [Acidimicrobiales bacterium]